MEALT